MTDSTYVVFHRGGRRFALPLGQVRRIAHPGRITPVPLPAPGVLGILESRGLLFTLIQTPLPPPSENRNSRIILVQSSCALGFYIDGVEGVREAELKSPTQGQAERPGLNALTPLPHPESRQVLGPQVMVGGSLAWTLDLEALAKDKEGVTA